MPGSGKTIIGEMLAEKLKFEFYDCDAEIEKYSNKIITEIFEEDGEEKFRQIETDVIKELSKKDESVISLGGGAILKKENIERIKPNAKIIFINRPLENIVNDIEVEKRPLLRNGKERVYELYNSRIELYKKYSDIEIMNDVKIEEVIQEIQEAI